MPIILPLIQCPSSWDDSQNGILVLHEWTLLEPEIVQASIPPAKEGRKISNILAWIESPASWDDSRFHSSQQKKGDQCPVLLHERNLLQTEIISASILSVSEPGLMHCIKKMKPFQASLPSSFASLNRLNTLSRRYFKTISRFTYSTNRLSNRMFSYESFQLLILFF